jgi:hypothetical protein
MRTYEALSLMLTFGLLLIALITYLDRHNKPTIRNILSMFLRFAGALASSQASLQMLTLPSRKKITALIFDRTSSY